MEESNKARYIPKDDRLYGKCTVQVMIKHHTEYLKWKKYNGGASRWDFEVSFPALMRREYIFHTITDLNMITQKVVQLLQLGFDVRAVNWKLTEYESQLYSKEK